ncbi:hypothetical protein [Pandoraea terrigena]|uniref:CCHC-type domain-containing protein n=1 Tax=Pandoraea terrigena TaxID=2508292 RepID=A0A5E4V3M9_9BURK|nr:hypothetical protein [Pandoraea terrigena]VVE06847.1 hypothetical protein PTE31013_02434 [Pandoraea terrigena]
MNRDYCIRCGRQGHTSDECSLKHRQHAPTLTQRIDRFVTRFPGVAALIFLLALSLGASIVGAIDLDDAMRAAQPVVFRSV